MLKHAGRSRHCPNVEQPKASRCASLTLNASPDPATIIILASNRFNVIDMIVLEAKQSMGRAVSWRTAVSPVRLFQTLQNFSILSGSPVLILAAAAATAAYLLHALCIDCRV